MIGAKSNKKWPILSCLLQLPDYWVVVHNLKSSSDGGILDADDTLNDVADDREQVREPF